MEKGGGITPRVMENIVLGLISEDISPLPTETAGLPPQVLILEAICHSLPGTAATTSLRTWYCPHCCSTCLGNDCTLCFWLSLAPSSKSGLLTTTYKGWCALFIQQICLGRIWGFTTFSFLNPADVPSFPGVGETAVFWKIELFLLFWKCILLV